MLCPSADFLASFSRAVPYHTYPLLSNQTKDTALPLLFSIAYRRAVARFRPVRVSQREGRCADAPSSRQTRAPCSCPAKGWHPWPLSTRHARPHAQFFFCVCHVNCVNYNCNCVVSMSSMNRRESQGSVLGTHMRVEQRKRTEQGEIHFGHSGRPDVTAPTAPGQLQRR